MPSADNPATESREQNALPDDSTLQKAGKTLLTSENGEQVPFESFYTGTSTRNLIIFIRHFYCGICEEYIRALSRSLPPSLLAKASPPIKLTIIGCGDPVCIPAYRERTMTPILAANEERYPIYCDPTRALYIQLGMTASLAMNEKKPEYVSMGLLDNVVSSFTNLVGSGGKAFKGGSFSQNGGDWLFDEGGKLVWCHRMRNTGDHAEIKELKKVLGM